MQAALLLRLVARMGPRHCRVFRPLQRRLGERLQNHTDERADKRPQQVASPVALLRAHGRHPAANLIWPAFLERNTFASIVFDLR